MPLAKSFKKRRGVKKVKKAWYNRKYSAMQMAQKALTGINYVREMINCEKKYHDVLSSGSIDYNGTVTILSGIAQGDSATQRDGDSLLCNSLLVRGEYKIDSGATGNTSQMLRVIYFIDKNKTTATPTGTDILQSAGTVWAPFSPLNKAMDGRFKILRDRTICLNVQNPTFATKEYIKLPRHHVKYDGAVISKGQIYVMVISDQLVATPTYELYTRLGFYDN